MYAGHVQPILGQFLLYIALKLSQEQSQELDFSINTAPRLQGNDGPIIEPAASQLVKSLPRTVSAYVRGRDIHIYRVLQTIEMKLIIFMLSG